MTWVFVIVGGMVGAPTRYLTDRYVQSRHRADFPWGTLTVNVIASFVLGVVMAVGSTPVRLAVGTGFCGALSTYSTFAYEIVRLADGRAPRLAVGNAALSVAVGLAAAFCGAAVGTLLR
ncbi:fluoride efflux transporter FluC [Leekyejoonella antrihumi]|uniref:Fluoride-specific ion channel FluC n=1 Tax=Leekyejoonella antrihumi TaxID=1660198 RepID=A0A563E5G2_9MICO|nr:CrcB family protein [Leekyejoonella antrihumi]TWP37665.1 CrcB family protein [Leekyejoonella antrihumi]